MRRGPALSAHFVQTLICILPRDVIDLGLGLELGDIIPGVLHLLQAVFYL